TAYKNSMSKPNFSDAQSIPTRTIRDKSPVTNRIWRC
ncbi:MAG: hypothetical protein ACI90G_002812, partial [Urechidicola sp.]